MTTIKGITYGPKREGLGCWSRDVEIGGRRYTCSVTRGQRVVIPYKRRGENIGFHWNGRIYDRERGVEVWHGRVFKSDGCLFMLRCAGLVE